MLTESGTVEPYSISIALSFKSAPVRESLNVLFSALASSSATGAPVAVSTNWARPVFATVVPMQVTERDVVVWAVESYK